VILVIEPNINSQLLMSSRQDFRINKIDYTQNMRIMKDKKEMSFLNSKKGKRLKLKKIEKNG